MSHVHVNLSAVVLAIQTALEDVQRVSPQTPSTTAIYNTLLQARQEIEECCNKCEECEGFSCKFE